MTDTENPAAAAPAPVATIQKAEAAHRGLRDLIDHLERGEQKLVAEAKAEIETALKAVENAIEHLTHHLPQTAAGNASSSAGVSTGAAQTGSTASTTATAAVSNQTPKENA